IATVSSAVATQQPNRRMYPSFPHLRLCGSLPLGSRCSTPSSMSRSCQCIVTASGDRPKRQALRHSGEFFTEGANGLSKQRDVQCRGVLSAGQTPLLLEPRECSYRQSSLACFQESAASG